MSDNKLHEIIRVDHAGEFGAKVIYAGQIAALKLKKDHKTLKIVEHMKAQEDAHFDYFDEQLRKQKIRPTVMQPVWRVGGFALGFITALLDKRAAMACTTAVEEVIDEHYQSQLKSLQNKNEGELKENIEKFRNEELEHRDTGYENHAADLAYFKPLTYFVKATTKFAITISKKI
ncbi:MAG: demethoxyubiquinone hydroxylase family protein [Alphaproteobacteria bacterium]|nr:demethoxyubiquinone hydroxylase family protein [Alphaproteobacteria bacterium]